MSSKLQEQEGKCFLSPQAPSTQQAGARSERGAPHFCRCPPNQLAPTENKTKAPEKMPRNWSPHVRPHPSTLASQWLGRQVFSRPSVSRSSQGCPFHWRTALANGMFWNTGIYLPAVNLMEPRALQTLFPMQPLRCAGIPLPG